MSDEDEAVVAGAMAATAKKASSASVHDAALMLKLKQLTAGTNAEQNDTDWIECLAVTVKKPLELDDAEDDLKRELAFYKQALEGVEAAQARMDRLGIPYRRPDDYFAEMAKTDAHMTKIKRKMLNEQQAVVAAEERRKQRTAKKFGKQVQTAKLQERAQQRKAAMKQISKGKKGNQLAPEFDVGLDDQPSDARHSKRGRDERQNAAPNKRQSKDERFGKQHLRRDKRNSADSTADMRDFNRDRGAKGGRGGKGGRAGAHGGRGGAKARPGKERRRQTRN